MVQESHSKAECLSCRRQNHSYWRGCLSHNPQHAALLCTSFIQRQNLFGSRPRQSNPTRFQNFLVLYVLVLAEDIHWMLKELLHYYYHVDLKGNCLHHDLHLRLPHRNHWCLGKVLAHTEWHNPPSKVKGPPSFKASQRKDKQFTTMENKA